MRLSTVEYYYFLRGLQHTTARMTNAPQRAPVSTFSLLDRHSPEHPMNKNSAFETASRILRVVHGGGFLIWHTDDDEAVTHGYVLRIVVE